MSLLSKLKYWWGDGSQPKGYTADHFYAIPVDEDVKVSKPLEFETYLQQTDDILNSRVLLERSTNDRGGIVKVKHKQYIPDEHRHGGRVVKLMPRSLRHMKELAEKTDD